MIGLGYTDKYLAETEITDVVRRAFDAQQIDGRRVLIIIPDATRTAATPLFFRLFYEALWGRVAALDYLIALGTHQPLGEDGLTRLLGIDSEQRAAHYPGVHIYNHTWDQPATLATLGVIPADEIAALSGGRMCEDVPVTLNRLIFDYDLLVICGPTFPHEVVGFSGGNKYFFPGISGPEVINFTHWLGAVMTSYVVIGTKYTPVRAVIDRAAAMIDKPKLCFSSVVAPQTSPLTGEENEAPPRLKGEGAGGVRLNGLYTGSPEEVWSAAADLSAQVHIRWVDRTYRRVLSVMPRMYDDIWTAAKGMYKMEPAIEDGGEVIIYAPHITEISYTHGKLLDRIGYHCRDYFLKQWDQFKDIPGGVLAHSTHLRGQGTYDPATGEEKLRIQVTLATGIPRERCERLNLGYLDPATINPADWAGREDEGILLVPKAGEMLYRVRARTQNEM
jgi:nickel-dependent lactate racemase